MVNDWDVIFVGGGLASGLAALRLAERRPECRYLVVEQGARLGGVHTWSFHLSDVGPAALQWLKPLVARTWNGHDVAFPTHRRRLAGGYASIRSERFHEVISERCGDRILTGRRVDSMTSTQVRLEDGTVLRAAVVLDGRGFTEVDPDTVGYQKFFGLDLRLDRPHGLTRPLLMDAECVQRDGFRFFYVLPWSENRVLVEDTRYSDGPTIDVDDCRAEILRYAERHGWRVAGIDREEAGALPIPLIAGFTPQGAPVEAARAAGIVPIGGRAGLFHPTTGYSLPSAVRTAEELAALPELSAAAVNGCLLAAAGAAERRGSFYRLLNRMLFLGASPALRYRVLEKFYRLPEPTIGRFYAGALSVGDRFRILGGRPPIALGAALRCLLEPSRGRKRRLRAGLFRSLTVPEVAR